MVRVWAYAGFASGSGLLRRRDVDLAGQVITVGRSMRLGVETSTNSCRLRGCPRAIRLPPQLIASAAAPDSPGRTSGCSATRSGGRSMSAAPASLP